MRQILDFLFNDTEKPSYRNIVKWMWRLTFAGTLGAILVFIALSFTDLPSITELENPQSDEASLVLSENGEVLGSYYTENRVPVTFNELSPNLVNALIATEDERYYEHSGIDFRSFARAVVFLGKKGGASTITQQLAKLLFTGKRSRSLPKMIIQKLKEWIIAIRLERRYTKEEIIAMYLNKFEFINGAFGIRQAARIYFNKSQDALNVEEAAMLIGMLKNPNMFNPLRRPELVLERREVVLKQMQKNRFLNTAQYDSIRQLPLGLEFTRQTHIDGLAPYFRMELAKVVKEILSRPENLKPDGTSYNIYKDGLRIRTTIDPCMQSIAEEEMVKNMQRVQKSFWRTWRKLDPWTYKTNSETEVPVEVRKQMLTNLIRTSDRYQALRGEYLSEIVAELSEETGLEFHDDDREIERIVAESEKPGVVADLVSRQMISSSLAAQYRKVLRSRRFEELKIQWRDLQAEVEKVFSEPVEMRAFAYNDQMETDTLMSPLDSIKYHRMMLQTGVLAVDPKTGYVKVWVGGINHKYFQFDHVTINRQVGSTFKPFIYATAIAQQGFSPCYQVYDLPVTIRPGDGNFHLGQEWTPSNSDGKYTGNLLTLKEGLRQSKNTVSVHLMKQLGSAQPVRDLMDQLGIDKDARYPNGQYRIPNQPSICLGSADLSVLEMTGAYTAFANNGTFNRPTFLLSIEDKNGRRIFESIPEEKPALEERANYVMVEMLRYAATNLGEIKCDVGGKTGTTNDYADGWFMGITPNLVVGTWVGGEDRWISFRSIDYGQGAYMAKPFFREFIKRLEKEQACGFDAGARFYRPPGDLGIEMDCDQYHRDLPPLDGGNEFEDEFTEDPFQDENFQ